MPAGERKLEAIVPSFPLPMLFFLFIGWLIPVGLFRQVFAVLVSQAVSLLGLEDHPHGSDNIV